MPASGVSLLGGRVVDPASGVDGTFDVHVAEGRVLALGAAPAGFGAAERLDVSGLVVCPGLVDLCARLREPGEEHKGNVASESAAAVAGGITTVCVPPDTDPVVDTPAVVELIHQRGSEAGAARVEVTGALTRGLAGAALSEMAALGRAGCVALGNATRPVVNTEVMRRALEYAATFGLTVFIQPEDPWLAYDRHVHEGPVATRLGLGGIPASAETVVLARDLLLVEQTGASAHCLHLSTARSVAMIAEARARGLPVTASSTAHHLHLTDEAIEGFEAEAHVRPPLRAGEDREALREGLAAGVIDAVCSDHQPQDRDARLNPLPMTEPGISGLETLLPLTLALVEDGVVGLGAAIAALTSTPARILGLDRGALAPGSPADLCVFDPQAEWTLDAETMTSRGHNSPFVGKRMRGRVRYTMVGGKMVYVGDW